MHANTACTAQHATSDYTLALKLDCFSLRT